MDAKTTGERTGVGGAATRDTIAEADGAAAVGTAFVETAVVTAGRAGGVANTRFVFPPLPTVVQAPPVCTRGVAAWLPA